MTARNAATAVKNTMRRSAKAKRRRLADFLGISENEFTDKYLSKDESGEYLLKHKPCCFLETDGKCGIYEFRPENCRDFPFTDKPERLFSLYGLIEFAEVCLVVFEIVQRLKIMYGFKSKNRF